MKKNVLFIVALLISNIGFSQVDTISTNIYQTSGNLGIGTTTPNAKLDIKDNISEMSFQDKDGMTQLKIGNSGHGYSGLILDAADGDGIGSDYFNIYQDDNLNLNLESMYHAGDIIFSTKLGLGQTDDKESMRIAKGGNVGIGVTSPTTKLEVNGGIRLGNTTTVVPGVIRWTGTDFEGYNGDSWSSFTQGTSSVESIWTQTDTSIYYIGGNVGIGTDSPQSKIQIAEGDIYISDINRGIIMKSPDGNCWRGVLDNSGQLIFSLIDCPDMDNEINSIEKSTNSLNLTVYPNPSNTIINIELSSSLLKKLEYRIYSLAGQIQSSGKIRSNREIVDISNVANGTYIITIYNKNGDQLTSKKIIKE